MMKRFLFMIVVIFAFIFLPVPLTAYADVVHGNDFLEEIQGKTEYVGHRFYVNSLSGYVIPKLEPGSEKLMVTGYMYTSIPWGEVYPLANGEIVGITVAYLHNGEYWGVMPLSHSYRKPGWIRMDELLMIYDQQDFETLNKNNFYTYTGSYDAVLNAKKLVEWKWPGSDTEKRIVEEDIAERADVLYAYKDKDGREWGKTTYSERWICLSDPANDSDIPSFNPTPRPQKWSPDGIPDWSSNDVAITWPSVDIRELMSTSKPQDAFTRPFENEFYLQHEKELQKLDRSIFYVNAPDDHVVIKTAPGLDGQILTHWASGVLSYPNGAELIIEYVYIHEGEYWGYIVDSPDNPGYYPPGWVLMDHLIVRYNNDDFINEHKMELYPYEGDILTSISTETFALWEWPGSDKESVIWNRGNLEMRTPITKEAYKSINGREWVFDYEEACEWLYIENAYKDEAGWEWIYIETYWNRFVEGWICVNDPANREIPAFNPAPPPIKWSPDGIYDWSSNDATIWPPTDPPEWLSPNNPPPDTSESLPSKLLDGLINMPLLIVLLVVVLLAGTVVLIWVLRKPHKNNK